MASAILKAPSAPPSQAHHGVAARDSRLNQGSLRSMTIVPRMASLFRRNRAQAMPRYVRRLPSSLKRCCCALVATAEREVREGIAAPPVADEIVHAAYLCAAREGSTGRAVDVFTGRPTTAQQSFRAFLRYLGPQLEETGDRRCAVAMWEAILARGTGAMLQRRAFARRHAVADVVGALRRAFVDGPQTPPLSGGAHPAPDVPAL